MISQKPSKVALDIGISLPQGYYVATELNLVDLKPWHFVSDTEFDGLVDVVNKHYTIRTVIPFARRSDNDGVACFVTRDPEHDVGEIIVVHNFASPGYEVVARFQGFWDWFKQAVEDMIEWHEGGAGP